MDRSLQDRIESALGRRPVSLTPLSGGCISPVYCAAFRDGPPAVVKIATPGGASLSPEGFMLRYLAERSRLPVPRVLACDDDLLAMEHVESREPSGASERQSAEEHAADLLAELHAVGAPAYGFERDTLIGSLPQPNPWTASWPEFFAQQRLRPMARAAAACGRLDSALAVRVERVAERLDRLLPSPRAPGLIHGDV